MTSLESQKIAEFEILIGMAEKASVKVIAMVVLYKTDAGFAAEVARQAKNLISGVKAELNA